MTFIFRLMLNIAIWGAASFVLSLLLIWLVYTP